eukprot:Ihof_evm1s116 gene=Ihof_evmTU1s116
MGSIRAREDLKRLEGELSDLLYKHRYQYYTQCFQDVMGVLANYTGLMLKMDTHVSNTGISQLLLQLCGTIPVNYRGASYNIPIGVVLQTEHPINGPTAYVRPTPSMRVNPGRAVDPNGLIIHPYIVNWRSNHNLIFLLRELQSEFGQSCPVIQKSDPSHTRQASVPPRMTEPGFQRAPPRYPPQFSNDSVYPPNASNVYPPPVNNYLPANNNYPSPNPSNRYSTPPPLINACPYPPTNNNLYPPPKTTNYQGGNGYQGPSPSPPRRPVSLPPPMSNERMPNYPGLDQTRESISEQELALVSLKTAVQDKLHRFVSEMERTNQEQLNNNLKLANQLEEGKAKIGKMLADVVAENAEVNIATETFNKEHELMSQREREIIASLEEDEDEDIEAMVQPRHALYKQMIGLACERAAIQDTVYYLGKGLHKGTVNIEDFLK